MNVLNRQTSLSFSKRTMAHNEADVQADPEDTAKSFHRHH